MDQHNVTPDTHERSSVGRRTVLKGAAWSVPAVAVIGATPALAQSGSKLTVTKITQVRSGKNVDFTLTLKNTNGFDVTIGSIQFTTSKEWTNFPSANNTTPDTFAANSEVGTTTFRAVENNSSAAFPQLSFTLVDSRGTAFDVSVTINKWESGTITFSQS